MEILVVIIVNVAIIGVVMGIAKMIVDFDVKAATKAEKVTTVVTTYSSVPKCPFDAAVRATYLAQAKY